MSEESNHAESPPDHLTALWRRLKDHRIAQWTVGYIAVAYGIQHAAVLTADAYEWPHLATRISMTLLALGLPVAMTLAWYHGDRENKRISGGEAAIVSALLVLISLVFYVFVRPVPDAAPALRTASIAASAPANGISLAVLPFVNLSSDKDQEFFSDGMTDEITSALAKVRDLRVVGRTSAFQFKGQNKDLRAIGQALSARYLIDGSVRKAGERVRITAELVRADNGVQLWSESYDRDLRDVFAIQEDIAQTIAASLRVPLGLKAGDKLVPDRTGDIESHDRYLRAKALVRARGSKSLADAAGLLEQVVARDPNFAPAWALLGEAYVLRPDYDPAGFGGPAGVLHALADASLPKAEAAARRAIQLDANLPDGYTILGVVEQARGKSLLADGFYSQALAFDSGNPDTLHHYSIALAESGRVKDALAMRQRLQMLEPFVPVFNWNTALVLWLSGQNDAAFAMFKALPPDVPAFGRLAFAAADASVGRYGEAAALVETVTPELFPPGLPQTAARLLRSAPAKTASPQNLPRLDILGWVYPYIGARDRVLDYYERNLEAGYNFGFFNQFLWYPSLAAVRRTERFKTYVRRAGLVEYWRAKGWPDLCHPTTGPGRAEALGAKADDDFECN